MGRRLDEPGAAAAHALRMAFQPSKQAAPLDGLPQHLRNRQKIAFPLVTFEYAERPFDQGFVLSPGEAHGNILPHFVAGAASGMNEGSITKVLTAGQLRGGREAIPLLFFYACLLSSLVVFYLLKRTRDCALSGQRGHLGIGVFRLRFELLLKFELLIHDSGVIGQNSAMLFQGVPD